MFRIRNLYLIAIPTTIGIGLGFNEWYINKNSNNPKLIYVHIFHRHGQRTAVGIESLHFDKDSLYEENLWKNSIAQKCIINNHKENYWKHLNKKLTGTYLISHKFDKDIWNENDTNIKTEFDDERLVDEWVYSRNWMGKLTQNGIKQLENVGIKLRKKYVQKLSYLSSNYDPKSRASARLWCNSTNFSRTIFSADAVLLGLYPMENRVNNAQIPIHIEGLDTFTLCFIPNLKDCAYLKRLWKQTKDAVYENDEEMDKFYKLKKKICDYYSIDVNDKSNLELRSSLNTRKDTNIDYPFEFDEECKEYMKIAIKLLKKIYFYQDKEIRSLVIGRTLYYLLGNMKYESSKNRFIISSAHDNLLMALKLCVGIDDEQNENVKLGEYVTFEVWQYVTDDGDNQQIVKVLVNDIERKEIPLNKLENQWKNIMMNEDEWNRVCQLN